MVDPYPPRHLPRNFFLIAIATLIALAGYVIFAVRFGDPMRRAGQAVAESRQIESRVTNLVKREVAQQVQELATTAVPSEAILQRVAALETQITALQASMQGTQSGSSSALGHGPVVPQVAGSTAPAFEPSLADSARKSEKTPLPGEAVVSDRKAGMLFTLDRAKVTERGLEIHVSVTKDSGGDGAVTLWQPGKTVKSKSRMVTVDGLEYDKGRVGLAADKSLSSAASTKLIEGVPMRFVVQFLGTFEENVICRRIEIEASPSTEFSDRVLVRFENIPVERD